MRRVCIRYILASRASAKIGVKDRFDSVGPRVLKSVLLKNSGAVNEVHNPLTRRPNLLMLFA